MLQKIKFGDCKVTIIQKGNKWFAPLHYIGVALGVSSDTLKGIIRNHLPQQDKFSRKENAADFSYDGSKLFTTISGWDVQSYIRLNKS